MGLVKTDLAIQLPTGCYGRIAPRSGYTIRHHITVGAGVIDEDFRGNICIVLFNHSKKPFVIHEGDRVAQFICERIFYPILQEVKELDATERGIQDFGSTG
jgi:dUTP pyrophosphatase